MDALHATFLPILETVLQSLDLPHNGIALDLASGAGYKLGLLRECLGEQVVILALDCDQQALAHRAGSCEQGPAGLGLHACVADAHALPLADASIDVAFCLAALGLFADRRRALAELRRVLKPQAAVLLSLSEMRWCERITWPTELLQRLRNAYALAMLHRKRAVPASTNITADLESLLHNVGFAKGQIRSFLLDAPDPLSAELALLPWESLRPLLAAQLSPQELLRCDECAATTELELCPLVMLAHAIRV